MKNDLMIFEHKEHAVVSSRAIAERFNKRHNNLMSSISTINSGLLENKQTPARYFIKSHYIEEQNGQRYPEYLCTRDGFSLLVMGFTGKEALEWKVKYINAFNQMEAFITERKSSEWLITRKQGKLIRRNETDTLANLAEYAEAQGSRNMRSKVYTIYSNLVNCLVGIKPGQRDIVLFKTISVIAFLEDMILHTVDEEMQKGTHYKDIYKICKANGEQIMHFAYLTPGATSMISA